MASRDVTSAQLKNWQAEKGRSGRENKPWLPAKNRAKKTEDVTSKPFPPREQSAVNLENEPTDCGKANADKDSAKVQTVVATASVKSILGKRKANDNTAPESRTSRREQLENWRKEKQQKVSKIGTDKPAFVTSGHLDYRRYTMDALPKVNSTKLGVLSLLTVGKEKAPLPLSTKQSARRQTMAFNNKSTSLKPNATHQPKMAAFSSGAVRFPSLSTRGPLKKPIGGLKPDLQTAIKLDGRAKPLVPKSAVNRRQVQSTIPPVKGPPRSKPIIAIKPKYLASSDIKLSAVKVVGKLEAAREMDEVALQSAEISTDELALDTVETSIRNPSTDNSQQVIVATQSTDEAHDQEPVEVVAATVSAKPVRKSLSARHRASVDSSLAAESSQEAKVTAKEKSARKSLSTLHRQSAPVFKKPTIARKPTQISKLDAAAKGGEDNRRDTFCLSNSKPVGKAPAKIGGAKITVTPKSLLSKSEVPKQLLSKAAAPKLKSSTTVKARKSPSSALAQKKRSPLSLRVAKRIGSIKSVTPARKLPIVAAVRGRVATPAAGAARGKIKTLTIRSTPEAVDVTPKTDRDAATPKSGKGAATPMSDKGVATPKMSSPVSSLMAASRQSTSGASCGRRSRQCTPAAGILKTAGRKSIRKSVAFKIRNSNSPALNPSLRANLDAWLANKKLTPSICRHLHCFGSNGADSLDLKLRSSPATPALGRENTPRMVRRARTQFAGHTPLKQLSSDEPDDEVVDFQEPTVMESPIQTPKSPVQTPKSSLESASDLATLQGAQTDLMKLLDASYPPQKVSEWLDEMYITHPVVQELAEYWQCRSMVSATCGDVQEAVVLLERGIARNAQPIKQLEEAKESLSRPLAPKRRTPRRKSVDVQNAFKSTAVQFEVIEKSTVYSKVFDVAESESPTPLVRVTPVRRSKRVSRVNALTPIPSTPSSDRRATFCVENLNDIPSVFRRNIFYADNPSMNLLMATASPDMPNFLRKRVLKNPRL